jgi:hypothetical protein
MGGKKMNMVPVKCGKSKNLIMGIKAKKVAEKRSN